MACILAFVRLFFFPYLTFCWMNCQSRVGPVQWLKPYTDEVLVELGQKGVKSLLAVPVRYTIINLLLRQSLLA
jgi:protoheme ferro-lyase